MTTTIRSRFFDYGYLLPTLVPLAAIGGRALADLLVVIYLLWAVFACAGARSRGSKTARLAYTVLLVALLASVPGAEDPARAAQVWCKFVLYSGVFYFTLVALRRRPDSGARLVRVLGVPSR